MMFRPEETTLNTPNNRLEDLMRPSHSVRIFLLPFLFLSLTAARAHAEQSKASSGSSAASASSASSKEAKPALPVMPSSQPFGFAEAPPDGYDITSNPVIAQSLQGVGKAYYMGQHDGLDGWLLTKGNEIQVVYAPADRKTIIIGSMYTAEGDNLTADQIKVLLKNKPQVGTAVIDAAKEQFNAVNSSQNNPASAALSAKVGQAADMTQQAIMNGQSAPAILPGEKFLLDMQDANGLDIGSPEAPLLYMIMDPNDSRCQATWSMLRTAVLNKTIRVRLIPVGMNDEDERAAAQLLHSTDPLDAWDKYATGDKSQLAGSADPKLINEVKSNHAMMDSWSISQIPYLAYRSAKDGEIKVVVGQPAQEQSLIADVGR